MVVLVNYPKKSLFQANDRLTKVALVMAIISYNPLSKNLKM